ncbi:MAG: glucosaminidase domain-containing protein [Lactococcus raffinolactis]|uniref:glucosaminidase domain-containing protein n=1 Tax=Pseudolactococcus raffinolactis TaxID=1366 RepID=UPI0039938F79
MKRKVLIAVLVAVSTCFLTLKVQAASRVNDYILQQNIQPIGEQTNIQITMQNPAANGGINMNYVGNKPQLVIIHETANDSSTLNNEITYMVRNQENAFVHSFVSDNQLITIADKSKKAWGAGPYGNQYGIQIEQTRVKSKDAFARQIANLANWTAIQMIQYNLGVPKLVSTTSKAVDGNLASHENISYKWGGTDHGDPVWYWNNRGSVYFGQGYDIHQFRDLVEYYYRLQGTPKITSTSIEGNPATGDFKVRVKTSGGVSSVSVPIWSNANGQDDLTWYPAIKVKEGEYLATFDGANHNYESGTYSIHAYAYSGTKNTSTSVSSNLQVGYPVTPSVHYQTQVQSIGWQQSVTDGETSGTVGQSLRVEAMKLAVTGNVSGDIQYKTHVQSIGWQNNVTNNDLSGTTGQQLCVEAIQIDLTGNLKSQYDIYYRVQVQERGWLGWAKNGESAGTKGFSLRLEAMQVKLAKKGSTFNKGGEAFMNSDLSVSYQTHVQDKGWQSYVRDGALSGTSAQQLRLEGIKIGLDNVAFNNLTGAIQYQTHVQKIGWQNMVSDNAMSGTTGQSLRLEAIRMSLTGTVAQSYDVYYRVHVQDKGWLGWAKNGEFAGTQGLALRLEAIQIKLVKKGEAFDAGGIAFMTPELVVNYQTHVQTVGWQAPVKDGEVSGTSGKSLRLEGIKVKIDNIAANNLTGDVHYQTHIQNIGWQNPVSDNDLSGTTGQELRLEAIRINLTGTLAQNYDIYYRVHVQSKGWLGWAQNGASAGSQGLGLRLEAIQIKLVKKGIGFDVGGTAFVVSGDKPTPTPIPTPTPPFPAPSFNLAGVNDTQKAWLNSIYSSAQKLGKDNDLFPSIMMSQTIAESAWGQSELATKANNLFGIKADATWKGAIYTKVTNEVVNGQTIQVTANFRKYNSQAESLTDYVTKIRTTMNGSAYRYQGVWRSNARTYQNAAQALKDGGYATDPDYPKNLIDRIVKYRLDTLD